MNQTIRRLVELLSFLVLISVLLAGQGISVGSAQSGPILNVTNTLVWGQQALTLAAVQGYTYRYYLDGGVTGLPLVNVTCQQDGPMSTQYLCTAPMPTLTSGPHTLAITAGSVGGESVLSPTFAFVFTGGPLAPFNLRGK